MTTLISSPPPPPPRKIPGSWLRLALGCVAACLLAGGLISCTDLSDPTSVDPALVAASEAGEQVREDPRFVDPPVALLTAAADQPGIKKIWDGASRRHGTVGVRLTANPAWGYEAVSFGIESGKAISITRIEMATRYRPLHWPAPITPTLRLSTSDDPTDTGATVAEFDGPDTWPTRTTRGIEFRVSGANRVELKPDTRYWLHFTGGNWQMAMHNYNGGVSDGLRLVESWNHGRTVFASLFRAGKWPGGWIPNMTIYGGVFEDPNHPKPGCSRVSQWLTFSAHMTDDPYRPGHDGSPEPIYITFDSKIDRITADQVRGLVTLSCGSVGDASRLEGGHTPAFAVWIDPCNKDVAVGMRESRALRNTQGKYFRGAGPITIQYNN